MIIRTDAVVLRAMDYGETSRIATLFTREKGKLAVLAKGARLPKSRFGATLQPMAYTQVVFYYKPTRSLQTLTESAHVRPLTGISRELVKLAVGQRIVELVAALTPSEEPLPPVFNLLVEVLDQLNAAEDRAENVLPYFQLRLAIILGFAPHIDRTEVEALPEDGGLLDLDTGAILLPEAASSAAQQASRTALRAYAIFARADLDTVMRMHLEPPVRAEVNRLIDHYLRYHVEDAYPTRSEKITGRLLG